MSGYDISVALVLLGSIFGLGYSLLGIGLVLTFRSSGFINFAHGAVGLFAAAIMGVVVNGYAVPYWLGFLGALILAALIGAGLEMVVVRKLSGAPKVLAMVATLGTGQALLLLALSSTGGGLGGANFPQPPWLPDIELNAYVSPSAFGLLVLSPVVVGALWLFLNRSRYGVAIRFASSNPDAATLAGVDPNQMAMLSWALAGAISAFTAMLLIPNQATVTPDTLGPDFIIRGLAVAAIARFSSLPIAFVAGIGLGIVEQIVATNPSSNGYFDVVLFIVVLVGVFTTARSSRDETEPWGAVTERASLPERYRSVWVLRHLGWVIGAGAAVVAAVVPIFASNQTAFIISTVLAFAIIAMSVTFLTGLAGQLSLGQAAFAAIGAVAAVEVVERTDSLIAGIAAAGVTGMVVSALVGLPALRVRGLLLAVATLAFALATSSWLLRQGWAFGTGVSTRPISVFGREITDSGSYYFVALGAFIFVLVLAVVAKNSSFGRDLQAVRDNEQASRVFQINSRRVTLAAYAFSGLIAGIGGAVLAFANSFVSAAVFEPTASIDVVAIAVVGGLGEMTGPLLGSALLIGIPEYFTLELSALAGLNAAWLILILEQPRGLVGLGESTRRSAIDWVAARFGVDTDGAWNAGIDETERNTNVSALQARSTGDESPESSNALLEVTHVSKRFGGLTAVDDVTLEVVDGEILGLIGPNGAGKTTLFELISGFVKPSAGRIVYEGRDITGASPDARSRLGLVRSFQNASLFPTMTPLDVVAMAEQRAAGRHLVLGGGRHDREIETAATDTLAVFGLAELATQPIAQLSTGARRLVELAANVALRPRLLLLDEPSAGIAQAETEALGVVIEQIRGSLGVTVVVIEHDMPLLTTVCDRMIALEIGAIISEGTPAEVQSDPAVVRSYLGDDPAAIARSGTR